MFKQQILEDLKKAVKDLGFQSTDIVCDIPKNSDFGDYTSNIALQLAKLNSINGKQTPIEIAKEISKKLKDLDYLERVEVAGGGFINFYIKPDHLMQNLHQVCDYACFVDPKPKVAGGQQKRIFMEYAQPNSHKPFHIGHTRNVSLGESLSRLLEACGDEVFRSTYGSDIGLPVAKALWGIMELENEFKEARKQPIKEKVEFLGKAYVYGSKAYDENEEVRAQINQINTKVYQRDSKTIKVWEETKKWSFDYFDQIYQVLGTKFDRSFWESEVEGEGKRLVSEHIGEVFEEDAGAIIFPGEKYGLHNRVFINSAGNPTYEAKDLGLVYLKEKLWHFDQAIILSGSEQIEYFKVMFKALEMIDGHFKEKVINFPFGMVNLSSGKMSSRTGTVITFEWLLEEVKKRVSAIMSKTVNAKEITEVERQQIVDTVSMGAIKFTMLKFAPNTNITFDLEKSVSLEGDSGPYIQYTYARAKSVLRNAQYSYQPAEIKGDLEKEELILLRQIEHFDSIIKEAATNYAPHLVANFLVDFARNFNLFYQKYPIVKHDKSELRLAITCAVAVRIKQGLYLLGIESPERM